MNSVAMASAAFARLTADAQDKGSMQRAEHDHSLSEPDPENRPLTVFCRTRLLLDVFA
jgi:hypothetical protein